MELLTVQRLLLPGILAAALVLASAASAACGSSGGSDGTATSPPAVSNVGELAITVYKSPTCGCCSGWEEYLREHGFSVTSVPTDDMDSVKGEHGIPEDMQSCHTAVIGDYYIEGHVPIEAIMQLLEEQPAIDGIALPGMPAGSPGMSGEKEGPFTVYAISEDETSAFGEF
jgi:hypothetical protein